MTCRISAATFRVNREQWPVHGLERQPCQGRTGML